MLERVVELLQPHPTAQEVEQGTRVDAPGPRARRGPSGGGARPTAARRAAALPPPRPTAQEVEQGTRVDAPGPRRHRDPFERREAHRRVDRLPVADGGGGGAPPESADT